MLSFAAATVLTGPYPEDCTRMGSALQPHWYKECTKAVGGCFTIAVPKESDYNIGPTVDSRGREGSGTEWCADHLNGFVYARVNETAGAQYFEIDEKGASQGHSCRFLVGYNGSAYSVQAYMSQELTCGLTNVTTAADLKRGETKFSLAISVPPVVEAEAVGAAGATGACSDAADTAVWTGKGKANFESDMSTCGHKCLGSGSCVKSCIKSAEGYSDACSSCFGALAQCTKDHCMLKCIHGESDACKTCVQSNCDPAFTTCSGISDIPDSAAEASWATKIRATPMELELARLEAA